MSRRVYAEGWQSWSPATVYEQGSRPLLPAEQWQHTMRYRPGTPLEAAAYQAEGLAVIDPGDGGAVTTVVTRDLGDPATVWVGRQGDDVRSSGPVEVHEHATMAQALMAVGETWGRELGARTAPAPRVWCSWYRYFEGVTAQDVRRVLADISSEELPVDVVQIDDGWSTGLGDGLHPCGDFADGGLARLVGAIRDQGHRAGLWLAPFLVGRDSEVAREHPGWLTGDAGRNWGQDLVGLDLLHQGVQDLLRRQLGRIRDLGIDYLKLDFLYAGALPAGPGGAGRSRAEGVAAYRAGLGLIREVMGEDSFLLGCGAPILPSIGLVDGMRVSPDTFHEGGADGSSGLRGLMSSAARSWMHGRLWANDPDCTVARPSFPQRDRWAEACLALGGLRSWSDAWSELDGHGRHLLRRLLDTRPPDFFDAAAVERALQVAAGETSARGRGELG